MAVVDELRAYFWRELNASRGKLGDYEGRDWWQITLEECVIFGLKFDDMPALVVAWGMYDAIADIAHNDFHRTALCRAARAELDYIKRRTPDVAGWIKFAGLFDIPPRVAYGWFYRLDFLYSRAGATRWRGDEEAMPRREVDAPTEGRPLRIEVEIPAAWVPLIDGFDVPPELCPPSVPDKVLFIVRDFLDGVESAMREQEQADADSADGKPTRRRRRKLDDDIPF